MLLDCFDVDNEGGGFDLQGQGCVSHDDLQPRCTLAVGAVSCCNDEPVRHQSSSTTLTGQGVAEKKSNLR